ncbi:MAG: ATP-grasp domain-containing protein [Solirubrobacterales bacterium]
MSSPRIAIATCAFYDREMVDDELLAGALRERGAEAQSVAWDDPDVDWSGFDLCLVRSTWDYHDKHREFLAWTRRVEAAAGLRNPAGLIAWNVDKGYLRELAAAGVPTVPTVWVERGDEVDLEEVLVGKGWTEAVVKPVVDLGARNLQRARAGEGSGALELALRRHPRAMVQPFLPSLESEGELSLIYVDGHLTHAVRKRAAPGDFRVQGIWGGTVERAKPGLEAVQVAERALAQLDEAPLYARVDLVADRDGALNLIELELIEPNLYFTQHPPAATALAEAALLRIDVDA